MIQSILFDKDTWTKEDAEQWLDNHNFIKNFEGKSGAHETKNQYRFRQKKPNDEVEYFNKEIDDGIHLVLMYMNGGLKFNDAIKLSTKFKKKIKDETGFILHDVGSITRQQENINDMDFITTKKMGDRKWLRGNFEGVNFDIWYVPKENMKLMKDIRSYPEYYIIALRKALKNKNWKLTDQEIISDEGEKIKYTNMKDLSNFAGIEYHPLNYYYEI